jgi:hypothetical protein
MPETFIHLTRPAYAVSSSVAVRCRNYGRPAKPAEATNRLDRLRRIFAASRWRPALAASAWKCAAIHPPDSTGLRRALVGGCPVPHSEGWPKLDAATIRLDWLRRVIAGQSRMMAQAAPG